MKKLLILIGMILCFSWYYVFASDTVDCKDIPKEKWTTEIEGCWGETTYAFQSKMIEIGYDKDFANYLINMCKIHAERPHHCVVIGASIAAAESSKGTRNSSGSYKDENGNVKGYWNVMGVITSDCKVAKTRGEGISCWGYKYVTGGGKWWKAESMNEFYSVCGTLPKRGYCVSEASSNCSKGCPNGLIHSTNTFNALMEVVNKYNMGF